MSIKRNVFLETQLLDILSESERPMTAAEIAHRLQLPLRKVEESVGTLKNNGTVKEASIEELMMEGK